MCIRHDRGLSLGLGKACVIPRTLELLWKHSGTAHLAHMVSASCRNFAFTSCLDDWRPIENRVSQHTRQQTILFAMHWLAAISPYTATLLKPQASRIKTSAAASQPSLVDSCWTRHQGRYTWTSQLEHFHWILHLKACEFCCVDLFPTQH